MSEPTWTRTPTEAGVYWYQWRDYRPDICWFHLDGRLLMFPTGLRYQTLEDAFDHGAWLYGPLPHPPTEPPND